MSIFVRVCGWPFLAVGFVFSTLLFIVVGATTMGCIHGWKWMEGL